MKLLFPFLTAFFVALAAASQTADYTAHIAQAEHLYQMGDFAAASAQYSAAFQSFGWKGFGPDRYNAARAWSQAGVPDSAFFNLFRLAERLQYDKFDELLAEKAFIPLHAMPRWAELCTIVKSNQPSMPELAKELAAIYIEDQKYRQTVDSMRGIYGQQSAEMDAFLRMLNRADSMNTRRVTEILGTYGWLGAKAVGARGNSALFLVVQHADIKIQEKYLPMMREAVKNGNAEGSSLALLEDRVLMRNGKKQIYGSQLRSDPQTGEWYLFPIEDVDHVDERRAAVGLGPLAQYAEHFGIVWDADTIEKNRNMDPGPKKP